jgi:glutamate synthase (NADPH/NADH) large chain
LKGLVQEHLDNTDSAVAKAIIGNWDKEVKNFKKVMPRDFKRVLLERAAKAAEAKKEALA